LHRFDSPDSPAPINPDVPLERETFFHRLAPFASERNRRPRNSAMCSRDADSLSVIPDERETRKGTWTINRTAEWPPFPAWRSALPLRKSFPENSVNRANRSFRRFRFPHGVLSFSLSLSLFLSFSMLLFIQKQRIVHGHYSIPILSMFRGIFQCSSIDGHIG